MGHDTACHNYVVVETKNARAGGMVKKFMFDHYRYGYRYKILQCITGRYIKDSFITVIYYTSSYCTYTLVFILYGYIIGYSIHV